MDIIEEIEKLKNRIKQLEDVVFAKQVKTEKAVVGGSRDKTKYMFEGKVWPKNRLVLAVIKRYVKDNSPTFSKLSMVFDKSLQGSLNVVELFENAENISDGAKRYFMNGENVLHLCDNTKVVVCTQWGIFNIVKFLKVATMLGYEILEI